MPWNTLTINKTSLFLSFVQGERCFAGRDKTFLLIPWLLGLSFVQTDLEGVCLCLHRGRQHEDGHRRRELHPGFIVKLWNQSPRAFLPTRKHPEFCGPPTPSRHYCFPLAFQLLSWSTSPTPDFTASPCIWCPRFSTINVSFSISHPSGAVLSHPSLSKR